MIFRIALLIGTLFYGACAVVLFGWSASVPMIDLSARALGWTALATAVVFLVALLKTRDL